MTNQGPIPQVSLRDVLNSERDNAFAALNKVQIGTIVAYDATKQKAQVQLVNKRVVYNTPMTTSVVPPDPQLVPYPVFVDVPVFVFSGGGSFLSMPIAAGDTCLVLFNDRDLDPWCTNGTTGAAPNSTRMHSLADGIALVGIRPFSHPLAGTSATDIIVKHSSGDSLTLNGTLAGLARANGTNITAKDGSAEITTAAGATVKADGTKVLISDGAITLKTVLDALCTALTSWVDTRGDSPNPATVALITAAKLQADTLLE
jgi:hypothetical protein